MKRLAEINKTYESIIHSDWSSKEKDKALALLMSQMEREFQIPTIRNEEFERKNRSVIALYRKISSSRTFE
jgi:hypothetical protein